MYIGQALVSPFDRRTAGRPAIYNRRRRRQRRFTCLHRERYNEFCDRARPIRVAQIGNIRKREDATSHAIRCVSKDTFVHVQKDLVVIGDDGTLRRRQHCQSGNRLDRNRDFLSDLFLRLASYALCFFPSDGQTTSLAQQKHEHESHGKRHSTNVRRLLRAARRTSSHVRPVVFDNTARRSDASLHERRHESGEKSHEEKKGGGATLRSFLIRSYVVQAHISRNGRSQ